MNDAERLHCATQIVVAYLGRTTVEVSTGSDTWVVIKAALDLVKFHLEQKT